MVTLTEIAEALSLDPKRVKTDFSTYGKVISINPDNTYQVSLNGSDTTVKCARLTGAKVGDVVLVTTLKNGYSVVTGCVGGDTDAADAQATADGVAQHFWYDTDGAHVTEDTREDYEADPSSAGSNLLLTALGIYIRKALHNLASFLSDGLHIYAADGDEVASFTKTGGAVLNTPSNQTAITIGNQRVTFYNNTYNTEALRKRGFIEFSDDDVTVNYQGLVVEMGSGGRINVIGAVNCRALNDSLFTTTTDDLFTATSIAANDHKYGTVTFTNPGYYPLCIAGWNAPDAVFVPSRLRLSAQSTGSATVAYDVCNPRNSSATSKFIVYILWLKVTV